MRLIGPDEEITPADIAEGVQLWFEVGDMRFFLRPRGDVHYDEAQYVQRTTAALWRARPEMKKLAELPASEADTMAFQRSLDRWQKIFDEQEDGSAAKERAADMLAFLQRTMEGRTRADEEVGEMALLARDRYLAMVSLCDEGGAFLFPDDDAKAKERWDAMPLAVKNAARPHIWRMMGALETLPFG